MKRKDIKKILLEKYGNLYCNEHLIDSEKVKYLNRLLTPYKANGETRYFIIQFLNGDGGELKEKFWSVVSSSRLAFESYSWLVNKEGIKDVQFEYHLPGLNGSPKSPNMDVYIEKEDEIIFIESKFTETASFSLKNMPESYYKETAKGSKPGVVVKSTLEERYHGNRKAATLFSNLIKDYLLKSDDVKERIWFDIEQEIKHLIGITFFLLDKKNAELIAGKKISFKNVVYRFDDFDNHKEEIDEFVARAESIVNQLTGIQFSYEYKALQDYLIELNLDINTKCFGTDNKTVFEQTKIFEMNK